MATTVDREKVLFVFGSNVFVYFRFCEVWIFGIEMAYVANI